MASHTSACEEIRKQEREWRDGAAGAIKDIRGSIASLQSATSSSIDSLNSATSKKIGQIYSRAWGAMMAAFGSTLLLAGFLVAKLLHWL